MRRRTIFPRTLSGSRDREREYVMLREAWRANHPQASPRDYEQAMADIARKLKL